jgi:pyruvate,water dikinase
MTDLPFTRPLDELRRDDEPAFGGKSSGLGELITGGIPVPPGFALSKAAFSTFLGEPGLDERVAGALASMSPDDVDSVNAASRAISAAMSSVPVPEAVRAEIRSRYAELAAVAGEQEPPVAVRSSAVGEDSEDATFAGQQESYLWVRGAEQVCDAVRDCWESLYSPPAITYRARLANAPEPAMGVTVQLMVNAAVSGVMFTCNPVSGDPSMVAINASWGLGIAVVGGEVTPDDYLVSKVTGEVVRERVHAKQTEYVPGERGTVQLAVPADRQEARCLEPGAVAALVDLARRIQRYFGAHQDIEWALARGAQLPDGLFVVQSRPVTTLREREKQPPSDALSLVMGTFGARPTPAQGG